MKRRIGRIIHEFADQGSHRTGTAVDLASGTWLSGEVRRAGVVVSQEAFSLNRIDLINTVLTVGDRRLEGLPLFDGGFTDAVGVRGRLGALHSAADIGLAESVPNAVGRGSLGDARRENRHRAIVCVTHGAKPGLCPSNADFFLRPFGPPVLQVSSEQDAWLRQQAERGVEGHLVAHVKRTPTTAVNITAVIKGTDRGLPPLIVMTPRSGWYACASERGGGIACWLEVMRALVNARPNRTVLFVSSSGHELGHLGINAFVDRRPGILSNSVGWMHFGANIGAATDPSNTLQASDDSFDAMLTDAMRSSGLNVDQRIARFTIPAGEAEVVHRGGGRYVSILGRNALFHNPSDHGPHAVDVGVIAKFSTAFITVATDMAGAA